VIDLAAALRAARVVAVLRAVPDPAAVAAAVVAGGITIVEITLDSPDAEQLIAAARERHPEVLVGAGTVRTAADVDRAVGAGAAFCVAPATVAAAVERAAERGVPMVPGALTPTEVERAVALGAAVVKLFPGSLGGPDYVRELRGPLSDVPLLVTGGIDAGNARAFLDAGAIAVGAASSIARAPDPEAAARALVAAAVRSPPPRAR
jgi:2-dehydro-3-deoxyphosphogluconate aldolase/(4S)-4-hydroxy-2-oxoglutarate aldolase